jgi:hypothetical protein
MDNTYITLANLVALYTVEVTDKMLLATATIKCIAKTVH